MPNFPKNDYFLPSNTHTYVCVSGGKKYLFFGKFGVLCFLITPVLRLALLPYYQQNMNYCFQHFFGYFGKAREIL